MTLSRRSFVKTVGVGGAGAFALPLISARGAEAATGARLLAPEAPELIDSPAKDVVRERLGNPSAIRLDSNENPHGPGARALGAIRGDFPEASRYPSNTPDALQRALAAKHGVKLENISFGCGSTEILVMATRRYCSPERPLVTAAPTYEEPTRVAKLFAAPVRAVHLNSALQLDLDAMADAARGAGLVYLNNPNNPTATVHDASAVAAFVERVLHASPDTTILVDEAYHEYVDAPGYHTAIPLAMTQARVIVARTFSKVYGMAGLRIGYAVANADTIKQIEREQLPMNVNELAASAALASIADTAHIERERMLNRQVKELTTRFFHDSGYTVIPSEANFMMIDIRRDSRAFQRACRDRGILVGRPFPPLTTHARISMGTMEEMTRAIDVFKQVLATV